MKSQTPSFVDIFGALYAQGIAAVIAEFCKSDVSRTDFIHESIAPYYGPDLAQSVRYMDGELKVMIAGATRALQAIPPGQRTWDSVLASFAQNPVIEPVEHEAIIDRTDVMFKIDLNFFKWDPSQVNYDTVHEVEAWFRNLISDDDIIRDTKIDINVMSRIVARIGVSIDSFLQIFFKNDYCERTVVDIGVLRYPDIDHPYFKLYRIQLKAWANLTNVLSIAQFQNNGILGIYNCRKFKPRDSIIAGLKPETHRRAAEEAERLFEESV